MPGEHFVDKIRTEATSRDVMLVLIGMRWLGANGEPTSRLANDGDFVRQEIEAALSASMTMIPILIQGVGMPSSDLLPASIKALSSLNAFTIGPVFHQSIDRLITNIKRLPNLTRGRDLVIGIVLGYLMADALLIILSGAVQHKMTQLDYSQFFRLVLTALMLAGLYVGVRWLRYVTVALSAAALLGALRISWFAFGKLNG